MCACVLTRSVCMNCWWVSVLLTARVHDCQVTFVFFVVVLSFEIAVFVDHICTAHARVFRCYLDI